MLQHVAVIACLGSSLHAKLHPLWYVELTSAVYCIGNQGAWQHAAAAVAGRGPCQRAATGGQTKSRLVAAMPLGAQRHIPSQQGCAAAAGGGTRTAAPP